MPRSQDVHPTYTEIMTQLLDAASGPIPIQKFSEQILAMRTVQTKKPLEAIQSQIRQQVGHLLVFLNKDSVLSTRLAMQGARFSLQLNKINVDAGSFRIDEILPSYLPRQFPIEKVQFLDEKRQSIDFHFMSVNEKVKSILGTYDHMAWYADLRSWYRVQKVYPKDYLLFTILDWPNGIFQLDHEPYAKRDSVLLQQRNQLLADLFYEMLENATREDLHAFEAVPSVYARFPEKDGYPPDHWMVALGKDGRMSADDWSIRYSDAGLSPLENLELELAGESRSIPKLTFSKEEGKQVYRFRAELKDRPRIWREVEILGEQSLSDLNHILVAAFDHDGDHMGGFWKLVPRKVAGGRRMRFREVDLGDVDPFGEGSGANIKIAELGLTTGSKLKFVFDFGDWIEHTLTLDVIEPSQAKTRYPRESARNKPKYVYCVECAKKGKRTEAKWICWQCSERRKEEVVLCEECAQKHQEYYLDEILY
jgi:hypothetical protein